MKKRILNGHFYFTEDTDKHLMFFINKAYETKKRIVIEYNEGWEDFSGYHGGNGLKHSMYIGRSTGEIKVPLCIYRKDSLGGCELVTCKQAIKKYYIK